MERRVPTTTIDLEVVEGMIKTPRNPRRPTGFAPPKIKRQKKQLVKQ